MAHDTKSRRRAKRDNAWLPIPNDGRSYHGQSARFRRRLDGSHLSVHLGAALINVMVGIATGLYSLIKFNIDLEAAQHYSRSFGHGRPHLFDIGVQAVERCHNEHRIVHRAANINAKRRAFAA